MYCPNWNKYYVICNVTEQFKERFEKYFLINSMANVWYVPVFACEYCYRYLNATKNSGNNVLEIKYVYVTICLHSTEHSPDSCYFCQTQLNASVYKYQQ